MRALEIPMGTTLVAFSMQHAKQLLQQDVKVQYRLLYPDPECPHHPSVGAFPGVPFPTEVLKNQDLVFKAMQDFLFEDINQVGLQLVFIVAEMLKE